MKVLELEASFHEGDDGHRVLPQGQEPLRLLQELLPHVVPPQQCHAPVHSHTTMLISKDGSQKVC